MTNKREIQAETLTRLLNNYLRKDWIKSKRVIESVLTKLETEGVITRKEFNSVKGLIGKEKQYLRLSDRDLINAFDLLFIPPDPPERTNLEQFFT